MTPERWKTIEEVYQAACTRPTGARTAFLAAACGDDEALRREVESLLKEPVSDDGFLVRPAARQMIADAPAGAMSNRRLGGYHLQTLLGAGGMGEVYRAHDARLGRDVAIKVLPAAFTSHPERLARLEREARMLAALNHPNICAIYGLEDLDGIRCLILELVEGETLADKLGGSKRQTPVADGRAPDSAAARRPMSAHGSIGVTETLSVARQIADALEAAHEKGIVHRDLKPANIKITPAGLVKVLDFGLAKLIEDERTVPISVSREGQILGTAAYMSPEQARGKVVDKRGDIWAFGCLLYEMLTGRLAFPGETVSDTIGKILEREPDWSFLPATTPASTRRLLLRCLAKDPRQRLRDAGDIRIEIDAVNEALPGLSEATSTPHAHAHGRITWLPWVALAVIVTVVGIREVRRPGPQPENPLANAQFSRFTDWEGIEGAAEISADGRFVAFLANAAGQFDLWQSQVGTGVFHNLTEDIPPLSAPSTILRTLGFSGDGADLWFSPGSATRKSLMPLMGGTRRMFLGEGGNAASWSPDGMRLAYFKDTAGDPLFVADRTGADARQILVHQKGEHNHNPVWSPDGQWIYFVHGLASGYSFQMDVWRVRPSGGSPEQLTQQHTLVRALAPIDARTLLYVAHAEDQSGPWLWALDVASKITRRVTSGLERYTSVSASRDGRRVVATVGNSSASLWRVPILDRPADGGDAEPFALPTMRALAPRFGGTSLFYLSARGGGDGLWRFHDGQVLEIWKGADGPLSGPPAVSPDGSRVAVVLTQDGKQHLAIMSADGTDRRALAPSIDTQGTADWSPDANWIVTGGRDAQGPGLFKIPVDGGVPERLVAGQAINPVWSRDANLIVYDGPNVSGLAPLLGVRPDGASVELPEVRIRGGGHRFLPNGKGVVYCCMPSGNGTFEDFWLLDLATKARRQVTRLGNKGTEVSRRAFDVTPDGKYIVFDRTRETSDIVLIDLPK